MPAGSTVYVLGAGFNWEVQDWDGVRPPMARDFFRKLLTSKRYSAGAYTHRIPLVFQYIEERYGLAEADLRSQDLDLEEVFSLLDRERLHAEQQADRKTATTLLRTSWQLKMAISETIAFFEHFVLRSDVMRSFGERMLEEGANFITLNYDGILEVVLEWASGPSLVRPPQSPPGWMQVAPISDETLTWNFSKWRRPLAYGVKFGEVQLEVTGFKETYASGGVYYTYPNNTLYDNGIVVKPHGSLNWYRYTEVPASSSGRLADKEFMSQKEGTVVLKRSPQHYWMYNPPEANGYLLDPLIIPPVELKSEVYKEPAVRAFVDELQRVAKRALSRCSRLIIIGYSLPPTDTHIEELLREGLAGQELERLVIVNPDSSAVERAIGVVPSHKSSQIYQDLPAFLAQEPVMLREERSTTT